MIDPKLLTKENGFVEGCVVEYEYPSWGTGPVMKFWGKFVKVEDGMLWTNSDPEGNGYCECSLVISARPLTGPMAIWNFAPEWADFVVITQGKNILWQAGEPCYYYGEGDIYMKPFWSKANP